MKLNPRQVRTLLGVTSVFLGLAIVVALAALSAGGGNGPPKSTPDQRAAVLVAKLDAIGATHADVTTLAKVEADNQDPCPSVEDDRLAAMSTVKTFGRGASGTNVVLVSLAERQAFCPQKYGQFVTAISAADPTIVDRVDFLDVLHKLESVR